ncbi:MAG TPA: S41 family peptidase [Marinobacter sp.]|nr:S41 family peptidase [Marinobacter sp.]
MKPVRHIPSLLQLRQLALTTCLLTTTNIVLAQDQDSPTREIIEGNQNGERVEVQLPDPETQLPLDELRMFTEVFSRIKDAYVEEVSDRELLQSAIKGMLSDLDPHSTYLAPQDYEELEESTSGEFGGLGIEVGMENGFIKVIAPIDDTPAKKAGVQAGDVIIRLDQKPVKGMSLQEAVNLMRGKPGTTLTLTIMRDGESGPIEIPVTRDIITVTSVKSRMLEDGYGYVRITQFQAGTGRQFVDALQQLEKRHGSDLEGLVIDVRNNPGGVLQAAVDTADALLSEGLIVYTEGRIASSRLRFSANPGDVMEGTPIVVLINGGSASASEILAGALQDHERAVIMGTKSFGKGSVQTVIPLDETHAIKMTTALYFTPDGRSIQATGIKPDIEIQPAELTVLEKQPFLTEADLNGHLEGENEATTREQTETEAETDDPSAADNDYQLRSALNLLKGIQILNSQNPPEDKEASQ